MQRWLERASLHVTGRQIHYKLINHMSTEIAESKIDWLQSIAEQTFAPVSVLAKVLR